MSNLGYLNASLDTWRLTEWAAICEAYSELFYNKGFKTNSEEITDQMILGAQINEGIKARHA